MQCQADNKSTVHNAQAQALCYSKNMSAKPVETTQKSKPRWFKAKLYGWGWYPATWQGWAITAAYIGGVILIMVLGADDFATSWDQQLFYVWVPFIGLTTLFAAMAYTYGEKPRWQWGKSKPKP